jgi:MFS family permease
LALGSLLVALAPSFPLALLGRALQGVSAGGITPAASAVVGDSFPLDQCGKALGLIGATFGMAFVLGPLLASAILVILPWPWLFLINLPVAAGIIAVGLRTLPAAQRSTAQPPFDLVGSLVGLLLLTCLVLGLNQVLDPFIGVTLWPWLLAGASGLLLLFLRVEQRAVQPIMPFDVSRNRQIRLVYLLTIGAGFAMGSVVYVASLAVMAFGIAEQQAGLLLLPLVLASSVGSVLFGR